MFKATRIFILLLVLVIVALGAWRERSQSVEWRHDLPVNIYLINADGSEIAASYLSSLAVVDFKPIEAFMREEAVRYGRHSQASIEIRMSGILSALPPPPPSNGNHLEVISWSLRMRWWSYRNANTAGPGPQVKLYLLYFDPAQNNRLAHSTGLQKGLLGRVNVFASRDMASRNNVVIAHELLHTLGATDKYDQANNQPAFPDGYADPQQTPRWPQRFAEIMAGRIPVSANKAEMPPSLNDVVIGEKTAREINWM